MVLSAVCVVGCFISAGSVRGLEARMGFTIPLRMK